MERISRFGARATRTMVKPFLWSEWSQEETDLLTSHLGV